MFIAHDWFLLSKILSYISLGHPVFQTDLSIYQWGLFPKASAALTFQSPSLPTEAWWFLVLERVPVLSNPRVDPVSLFQVHISNCLEPASREGLQHQQTPFQVVLFWSRLLLVSLFLYSQRFTTYSSTRLDTIKNKIHFKRPIRRKW